MGLLAKAKKKIPPFTFLEGSLPKKFKGLYLLYSYCKDFGVTVSYIKFTFTYSFELYIDYNFEQK